MGAEWCNGSLWQIHVFGERNTRTTAVYFIKYLRTLGLDATNDIFAENAWYFRNALVRANYNDLRNGVHETTEYLELFLRNLLLDEKMNFIIVLCILVECLKKRTLKVQKRTVRAQKRILKIKKRTFEIDYFLFLI